MKWKTAIPLPAPVTGADELKHLLSRAESDLQSQLDADARLGGAVRLVREDADPRLKIASPWINGELHFTPSHLHVNAELSLAAWPFRGKIEGILKSWVQKCQTP